MNLDFVANRLGFEVLTPDGYKPFAGLAHMDFQPVLTLTFGNRKTLECARRHTLFRTNGASVTASALHPGDWVLTGAGRRTKVKSIEDTGAIKQVYDLVEVAGGNRYLTNGILSHNCDFVTDDETLINPLTLVRLAGCEPVYYTGTVRWFRDPEPNRTYLVGLDPSLGTGHDDAAIQVFMLPDMVQVAEWQHNGTAPRGQVRVLMQTLIYLDSVLREDPRQANDPDIFWTVENNSLGEAILLVIEDTGEERIPGTFLSEKKRRGQARRFRKGMNTTPRSKLSACARMKSLVESGRMTVHSNNLIKQMKSYVAREMSFAAKPGEHDDLIASLLLVVRMLDIAIGWSPSLAVLREYIDDAELLDHEAMPMAF